jgi:protein-S-isoprenylcysteine O-methyltransferase Ste14
MYYKEAVMDIQTIAVICIFLIASGGIIYISRASLRQPGSHGFYRFFAWECLLAMFLLNIAGWFANPWAWYQWVSWILLVISLYLVIQAILLLKQIGAQDARRSDAPMLTFEKTTRLVVIGAYRYIRHPLYASLLFLGWGMFFKSPSWGDGLLAVIVTLFLVATARAEEAENLRFFGAEYGDYMRKTRMFIPMLF